MRTQEIKELSVMSPVARDANRFTCEKDVENFSTLACVCGLAFPDTATQFQKSSFTLAHLMASLRESVLKGSEIPENVLQSVLDLAAVMFGNRDQQR